MKRKVTLVLLCVLLLSCAAFFTACGTKHTHSFTNYVPDNNATCTEDGTKTAKCDGCEETDTVADPGTAKGTITSMAFVPSAATFWRRQQVLRIL